MRRLVGNLVVELEGLEGFAAAREQSIGTACSQPLGAGLDDAGMDFGVFGQLGSLDDAGRPCADDEHIHGLRQFGAAVQARSFCIPDPGIAADISVVVVLHPGAP